MSKWPGCPTISCKNDLCHSGCERLRNAEMGKLLAERDEWHARAFAMFWMLPEGTTIGEIRDRTAKARVFLGYEQTTRDK